MASKPPRICRHYLIVFYCGHPTLLLEPYVRGFSGNIQGNTDSGINDYNATVQSNLGLDTSGKAINATAVIFKLSELRSGYSSVEWYYHTQSIQLLTA